MLWTNGLNKGVYMDKAVKTIMDNRSGEYDRKSRYRAVLRIPAFFVRSSRYAWIPLALSLLIYVSEKARNIVEILYKM